MNRAEKLRQALEFDPAKADNGCYTELVKHHSADEGIAFILGNKYENTRLSPLHKVLCEAVDRIESAYSMRQADIWLDKNMSPLEYIESEISQALEAIDRELEKFEPTPLDEILNKQNKGE